MVSHPYETLPFLLVTGQARSGTTALTRALSLHPEIHSNGLESNFLRDMMLALAPHLVPERQSQLSVTPDQFILEYRRAALHCLFPAPTVRDPLPRAVSTFSSLTPECQEWLPRFFPHRTIVLIVRNGVEVVSSRRVHRKLAKFGFEEHCRAWAAAEAMVRWGEGRDDFFMIRQEVMRDANRCPERLAELYRQCNLSPAARPARWLAQARVNTTRYTEESENGERDLESRRDRWQDWTIAERETFVRICGPAMEYLGYPIPWEGNQVESSSA